jgi:DNA-binding response OmpR family regulator
MKTILIIEDDVSLLKGLSDALTSEHYRILSSANGQTGFTMAKRENIDLIILDLNLPDKNGREICSDLRKEGIDTPILMLTSRKEEIDKVLGLETGADDYVTKPFSLRELIARVGALLRRTTAITKQIDAYAFGNVEIDFKKQEAKKRKKSLRLSARELKVLRYLIQREGEVVTREMLLNEVWGYEHFPSTRTVDNFILSLRKKIEENPSAPKHIITAHTAGYKFVK